MTRRNNRVLIGSVIIVAALVFLGFKGFQEGKTYYKTIEELADMGEDARDKRLRVAGIVTAGSIQRADGEVTFQIEQNDLTLDVRYTGSSPLPDTFKDGAEALCNGHDTADGTFEATTVLAKCASKYEAEYGTVETES